MGIVGWILHSCKGLFSCFLRNLVEKECWTAEVLRKSGKEMATACCAIKTSIRLTKYRFTVAVSKTYIRRDNMHDLFAEFYPATQSLYTVLPRLSSSHVSLSHVRPLCAEKETHS